MKINKTLKGFMVFFHIFALFLGATIFSVAGDVWGINVGESWTYGVVEGGTDWFESYNVTSVTSTQVIGGKTKTLHGEVVERLENQDNTWCFNKLADISSLRNIADKEETRFYGGRTQNCLVITNNIYDTEVIDTATGIYLQIIDGTKTYELVSWSMSGPTGQLPFEVIIIIIAICSIVAVVVILYIVKRKKSSSVEPKQE